MDNIRPEAYTWRVLDIDALIKSLELDLSCFSDFYYSVDFSSEDSLKDCLDNVGGCYVGWRTPDVKLNDLLSFIQEDVSLDGYTQVKFNGVVFQVNSVSVSESLVKYTFEPSGESYIRFSASETEIMLCPLDLIA